MKMKKRLLVFGTGSQARYVLDNVRYSEHVEVVGLVDLESPDNVGKSIDGIPICCALQQFDMQKFPPERYFVIIAYGDNRRKREISLQLAEYGYRFLSAIHPKAYIAHDVTIGDGCIINPNVTILSNAQVGNHVIIHSGAVIEHDCVLQDWVNVAPGVSFGGRVIVGQGAYVYTGSVVIPKVRIGNWAVVGAGAVVLRDVPDYTTVVGVPARVLQDE